MRQKPRHSKGLFKADSFPRFFFPVIKKFSEQLFRQRLLFYEQVIYYRWGGGEGEGGKGGGSTRAGFWEITWFSGGNGEDISRHKQSIKGDFRKLTTS